jgi:2-haloacid dehalogenase
MLGFGLETATGGPDLMNGIQACVFDAYGTLFDYASAAAKCQDRLGDDLAPFAAMWRDKQLNYTWLRAAQGRHADFWQVTSDALDFTMESFGIDDHALRTRLMNLYLTLDPFSEIDSVLARLTGAGIKLAILSNGTPAMLDAAVKNAKLDTYFDAIISVEEAGVFKPSPKVYRLAVNRLGVAAEKILFQSANAWDAYAASAFGMNTVWCNRYGQRPERLPGKPDFEVTSLESLPEIVGV